MRHAPAPQHCRAAEEIVNTEAVVCCWRPEGLELAETVHAGTRLPAGPGVRHLDLEHPGLEAPSLSPHSGAAGPPQLALGAISFPVTAANLAPCLVAAHGALGHFLHELPGLAGAVAT